MIRGKIVEDTEGKPEDYFRNYDRSAPAKVLNKKREVLWECHDILEAMMAFKRLPGSDRIERDGVLLAYAGQLSKEEYDARSALNNARYRRAYA